MSQFVALMRSLQFVVGTTPPRCLSKPWCVMHPLSFGDPSRAQRFRGREVYRVATFDLLIDHFGDENARHQQVDGTDDRAAIPGKNP